MSRAVLVIGAGEDWLWAFDPDGAPAVGFPAWTGGYPEGSNPIFVDFDQDGDLDLISVASYGGAYVWDLDVPAEADRVAWAQYRGDALNSGYVRTPMPPHDLVVSASGEPGELELGWSDPTHGAWHHLHIYRADVPTGGMPPHIGVRIGDDLHGSTFTDKDLVDGRTYLYTVRAVDSEQRESSNVDAVPGTAFSLNRPDAPTDVVVIGRDTRLHVSWQHDATSAVAAYSLTYVPQGGDTQRTTVAPHRSDWGIVGNPESA